MVPVYHIEDVSRSPSPLSPFPACTATGHYKSNKLERDVALCKAVTHDTHAARARMLSRACSNVRELSTFVHCVDNETRELLASALLVKQKARQASDSSSAVLVQAVARR